MGKSISKIRHIQEINKKIENIFVNETTVNLNENLWDRIKSNTAGFFSRFKTFGQNIGSMISGGIQLNPTLEASATRVKNRANNLQKELIQFENDLSILFNEMDKVKIEKRAEKLMGTPKRSVAGHNMQQRLEILDQNVKYYIDAIDALKGINEGLLENIK